MPARPKATSDPISRPGECKCPHCGSVAVCRHFVGWLNDDGDTIQLRGLGTNGPVKPGDKVVETQGSLRVYRKEA